jgi:hypothetical protein
MPSKSADYWQGYREQEIRSAAKKGRSAVDAMPDLASISREVAKNLGLDQGRKQRIFQRSPHVFAAMDAEEVAQASSRELAMRELQELGIDCGDNDPVAILDAHHAGRQYARDGGKRPAGMDSAGDSVVDRYLNSNT